MQKLLVLGVTGEQRRLPHQFRHDAPDAPHVHGTPVVGGPEQHLRGTVSKGNDFVGVRLDRDREGAAKTEVGDFTEREAARLVVDEKVLGLQVAVHDTVLVAVGDSADELVHELLDLGAFHGELRATAETIHILFEVGGEVLEDEVQHGLAVFLHVLDAKELHDVVGGGKHLE